ncbi:MnhB domain-containing protein [Egicoccus sp. AB-alg6-2]|uniref:MnhB domain-containing protein n=1 Tax=Egicoccus sp. AB-alg6-2 TaxID=3242692 RepID=UPI00359EAE6C
MSLDAGAARRRLLVFAAASGVLVIAFLVGLADLAPASSAEGDLAAALVDRAVERRSPNTVSGVLFDLRATDTLGEALALFAASAGLQLVLRELPDERRRRTPRRGAPGRDAPPTSDAVRAAALALVVPTAVFAVYATFRGHLSLGGGLQAGALAVTALALVFLAGRYRAQRHFAPDRQLDLLEAVSLGGYVVVGLAGLVVAGAFLANVLPVGSLGVLVSSGTILALSLLVGIEAGAAVLLIVAEVQEEPLEREEGG